MRTVIVKIPLKLAYIFIDFGQRRSEACNNRGKNIYPDVTVPRRHHELYTRSQGTILERLEHFAQGQKFSCVDEFIKR